MPIRDFIARRYPILIVTFLLFLVAAAMVLFHRWQYPYGHDHCCIKQIGIGLSMYAEKYGGSFPAGCTTPEASLSLLYKEGFPHPGLLKGKSVPVEVAKNILENGGLLGPDSCGWHYVEGLTERDDPRLAVMWDKVDGLGHDSQRIDGGGHEVLFIDRHSDRIPGDRWDGFMAQQARLLAERKKP
jgi:hypothetical protein